jgi:hypothetical protein
MYLKKQKQILHADNFEILCNINIFIINLIVFYLYLP